MEPESAAPRPSARPLAGSSDDREARLEALAAALIHRFNNVLMGIQPHVEVIKRSAKDNERVLGSATQIETALRRAKGVMSDVAKLARPVKLDEQPLAVDGWFTSLERELQPFATNPVEVTFDPGVDLVVSGDREQLSRAIANIVMNSVEAMPNGGSVSVTARNVADGIELKIADSGNGVAPEVAHRVFEPLFTTKRNSAGLGLPIAQQIVEAHGGTVRFDSTPDGTTVTVTLKRA